MKSSDLIRIRIHRQSLGKEKHVTAAEAVRNLVATQAQDYLGSLWSIGQRLQKSTEAAIEQAVANREIVRTWPMRGTLHFVAAEDSRWMLSLLTPRIIAKAQTRYKQIELDKKTFIKSSQLLEKALRDHQSLTRDELYAVLEKGKVSTKGERGIHLINHSAMGQVVCFGPRKGKQHTFVLLDEWVPESKSLTAEEGLAELTLRYFSGHAPATLHDFAWWSGLTLSEAKKGVEMNAKKLISHKIDDVVYWMTPESSTAKSASPHVSLLSWFDEFIISYKDRSAAFDPKTQKYVTNPKNGIYTPVILIDGKIAGNWKRTFVNKKPSIQLTPFRNFTAKEEAAVAKESKRLAKFLSTTTGDME